MIQMKIDPNGAIEVTDPVILGLISGGDVSFFWPILPGLVHIWVAREAPVEAHLNVECFYSTYQPGTQLNAKCSPYNSRDNVACVQNAACRNNLGCT